MKITTIQPTPPTPRSLRIAVYCRISTLLDGQLSSLENQRAHYTSLVNGHAGWESAGIYLEEGVTGTKKEPRPELRRMLEDCRAEKQKRRDYEGKN